VAYCVARECHWWEGHSAAAGAAAGAGISVVRGAVAAPLAAGLVAVVQETTLCHCRRGPTHAQTSSSTGVARRDHAFVKDQTMQNTYCIVIPIIRQQRRRLPAKIFLRFSRCSPGSRCNHAVPVDQQGMADCRPGNCDPPLSPDPKVRETSPTSPRANTSAGSDLHQVDPIHLQPAADT